MTRAEKIALARRQIAEKNGTPSNVRDSKLRLLPCVYLGPRLPNQPCGSPILDCNLHGVTTARFSACKDAARTCHKCGDYLPLHQPWTGAKPLYLDEFNLYPSLPGKRFNPAIIEWDGAYLFAWRDGWKGSNIWLCRMDRSFRPTGIPIKLELTHRDSAYGREDPTLFVFRGQIHVAFVGVVGVVNRVVRTNMLYARLNSQFQVEEIFSLRAPGVPPSRWEKNWQFFSHNDELYAIYSVTPHRILKVNGASLSWAYDEPVSVTWAGGEIRGSTSPVRVGDEYYCFFHDKIQRDKLFYRTGLYTFSVEPPFRPLRLTPLPVLSADPKTNPGNYCDCVFPRGAVRDENGWVVSFGVHDRFSELHRFAHADIEPKLLPINFRSRDGTSDYHILDAVNTQNEYRLPDRFSPDDLVIDIGAHVGTFTFSAWRRGSRNINCYEANADNFAQLSTNLSSLTGITKHHTAVWSERKTLWCRLDQKAEGNYSRSAWYKVGEDEVGSPVNAISLDEIIAGRRVAFLKLDCEGAEFPIILNCQSLHLVSRIAMEVHGDPTALIQKLEPLFTVELVRSADNPTQLSLIFASNRCG